MGLPVRSWRSPGCHTGPHRPGQQSGLAHPLAPRLIPGRRKGLHHQVRRMASSSGVAAMTP
eukprot:9904419-Alexandrium_andersonii.AAC.1